MNRAVHVSEHKWDDDPYEEERFEDARMRDYATLFAVPGCLFVLVALVLALAYWLITTITPGRIPEGAPSAARLASREQGAIIHLK